MTLAEYGDVRALSVLSESLESNNRDGYLDGDDVIDIADAIEELGGPLSPKSVPRWITPGSTGSARSLTVKPSLLASWRGL